MLLCRGFSLSPRDDEYMQVPLAGGRVFGRAGEGLEDDPEWAVNAQVAKRGLMGEVWSGRLLDAQSAKPPHATVVHDVMIPGLKANVDHIVVSGRSVVLIDSKVWAPGVYWTWRGVSRRGKSVFGSANKQTMVIAARVVRKAFERAGVSDVSVESVLFVWPSRGRIYPVSFRPVGAKPVVGGRAIGRFVRSRMRAQADRDVEQVIIRRFLGEQVAESVARENTPPAPGVVSTVDMLDALNKRVKE